MKVSSTPLNDCKIIELDVYKDQRGLFFEIYKEKSYISDESAIVHSWVQINYSQSVKNTIRGMHYSPFAKLLTCLSGKVLDVVIDLRRDSSTYLKSYSIVLDSQEHKQIYIPAMFGHGFQALEDSVVLYAQAGNYNTKLEKEISWKDNSVASHWLPSDSYILSEKDSNAKFLSQVL